MYRSLNDNEGPFIQNNPKYSPKVWLYDGIKDTNIRSLGVENIENKTIYDQNVETFWDNILKEEFAKCFITEGHIEDDISIKVQERNYKECLCGNREKSSKRKCSKCKEPLKKSEEKRFKPEHNSSYKTPMSGVERRRDIERGPDIKEADLIMGKPLKRNPASYEDTKQIIREESINSGIAKYGTGGRNWLAIACDGSPFKNFLALLPVLTICSTAGNTSTHLNNKDVEQIQLEFDHILPLKNFVWSM